MKQKVLITGINGFAGSHLADLLVKEGKYEVYGLIKTNARLNFIKDILAKITLVDGDVTDAFSMKKVLTQINPDMIYHLAALSWVGPSWDMPAAYMTVNAIGTINLLEAARKLDKVPKILITCTPEEYGNVPEDLIPITEETRVAPVNPYAASKAAQNITCQVYYASYGMPIVRTRAFNHEGPRREVHGAIASWAQQIARIEAGLQDKVIKVGNLEATRNFTDVRDTVKAYKLAMELGDPGELYLIGSDQIFTMKECLEKLIALSTDKDIRYEIDPERVRPTELKLFVGDFTKFKNKTDWKPTIPFDQTLNDVLSYWREQVKLSTPKS